MVMVVMRNVRHALKTTLFMMGDVWDVYQWRFVLSTTVMRFIVLMSMTSLIVLMNQMPQTVQTTFVFMGLVEMVFWKGMRNVRLEDWDAEDVCV